MGLFSSKVKCGVCNNEIGKIKLANSEYLCKTCYKKCGFMPLTNVSHIKLDEIKNLIIELESFVVTKKISVLFEVDEKNGKFFIPFSKIPKVYKFSDVVDFELIEDGDAIVKKGLSRAIAGGALFGGIGALVGGVTATGKNKNICNVLSVKIVFNDLNHPVEYLNFINGSIPKKSVQYKTNISLAQECLAILQIMSDTSSDEVERNKQHASTADELIKFKNLLDQGVLTQEEFELKKKQLLDI